MPNYFVVFQLSTTVEANSPEEAINLATHQESEDGLMPVSQFEITAEVDND